MSVKQLQDEILKLKKANDAIILAHYYQPIEIQEIADYLGDSLGLSQKAKEKSNTEYIIFAGVNFMAETASILNPDKHVMIPNPESCCPMADFLTPEKVKEYKQTFNNIPVVMYVNSTATVKAESDICCTSSNSAKIVKKIAEEYEVNSVLFGPDANLADYTEQIDKIKCIRMPENGHCIVHSQLTVNDVKKAKQKYPKAITLVHPECVREVRALADFIGSTSQMYNRVRDSSQRETEFIIGTELGLLERLAQDFQLKKFYLASDKMICYNMRKHNLELVKYVLENLNDASFEVKVPSEIAKKAIIPIEKMLKYS